MGNNNIFISYARVNKETVDEIDNAFKSIGIAFIRDVRDIGTFQSIKEFMKKIRENDYVLMVISDAYLKSKNCMYEVLEFMKEQDFKVRILPIILDDAKIIFSFRGKANYIKYWQDEIEEQKRIIKPLESTNVIPLTEELKIVKNICGEINEFLSILSDMLTNSLEELKKQNYKPILNFIGFKDNGISSDLLRIYMIKDKEEQEIEFDKNKDKYGETEAYCFIKGFIADEKTNFKLSKHFYEKALKLNPNYAEAHNNLALLLIEPFKDYNGAMEHYDIALKLNPNYAGAHNNLAALLETEYFKDYDCAKEHFYIALKLDPNYAGAHYNLAALLETEYFKEYDGAKEHYDIALKLNPNYAGAIFIKR